MKQFQNKFIILFVLLLLVIAAGIAFKTYQHFTAQKQTVTKKTILKQVLVKRSKDLGFISRALTGKAIDVNTGKIIQAARVFSPSDTTVYLQLDLNKPPKGTVIDYIRYKNNRYVDHGEVQLAKEGTKNILFNWTITRLLASSRDGEWKVATYTNGILAKRVNYEIRSNRVAYVDPEEIIARNDPDYHLNTALTLVSHR